MINKILQFLFILFISFTFFYAASSQSRPDIVGHCFSLGSHCGPIERSQHTEKVCFTSDSFYRIQKYRMIVEGMESPSDSFFSHLNDLGYEKTISGTYEFYKTGIKLHSKKKKVVFGNQKNVLRIIRDTLFSETYNFLYQDCGILSGLRFAEDTSTTNFYCDTSFENCSLIFESTDYPTKEYVKIVVKGFAKSEIFFRSEKQTVWIKSSFTEIGNFPYRGFQAHFPWNVNPYQFIPQKAGVFIRRSKSSEPDQSFKLISAQ